MYIYDEADSLVTNMKLTTMGGGKGKQKLELAGLLGMLEKAAKCYFVSATYSKFA